MQVDSPSPTQLQSVFQAIADPTRRSILSMLSEQDMTIGEIVDRFSVTRAAIKKHLVMLERGGLISVQQRGRERINTLEPMGLKSVDDWLSHFHQFWDQKLSKLQTVAENEERAKTRSKDP
ncbi:metalloregulator ArsR/SmtB family transcription factor [Roseibium sp. SCPC15]|uniref:ArsR/SmtB family transcription factor n=1 Tax=Roseibium sp. SCP15 TaxID=3141376 RepID=UPI0033382E73